MCRNSWCSTTYFSNIATLATATLEKNAKSYVPALVHLALKAYKKLQESLAVLDQVAAPIPDPGVTTDPKAQDENASIQQQLDFIYKLSVDITKASKNFNGLSTTEPPVHSPLTPAR